MWACLQAGAFDSPLVQRRPAYATLLEVELADKPVAYRLSRVPVGHWFIRAVAAADTADPEPWTRRTLLVGGCDSVAVAAGDDFSMSVAVRPRLATDLPILLALPDLGASLDRHAQVQNRSVDGAHALAVRGVQLLRVWMTRGVDLVKMFLSYGGIRYRPSSRTVVP